MIYKVKAGRNLFHAETPGKLVQAFVKAEAETSSFRSPFLCVKSILAQKYIITKT